MLLLIVASFVIIGVVDEMSCRRKRGSVSSSVNKATDTPRADELLKQYREYTKEKANPNPTTNKSNTPSWRK